MHKVGQNCPGFGRHLNGLFKQAVTAGKRVRAETSISSGAVSVSSAAAELAQLKLPSHDFNDAKVGGRGCGSRKKGGNAIQLKFCTIGLPQGGRRVWPQSLGTITAMGADGAS